MVSPADIVTEVSRLTSRHRLLAAGAETAAVTENDQLIALLYASRALDAAGIPHALIGGIAVGIRSGLPRATEDVDLAVRTTDVDELVSTMTATGFSHRGTHEHSINFRHDNGEPVQLALDPSFDSLIERAEGIEISGHTVRVVTREDLIAMKERSAHAPSRRRSKALRDLADVELLRGDVPEEDEGW